MLLSRTKKVGREAVDRLPVLQSKSNLAEREEDQRRSRDEDDEEELTLTSEWIGIGRVPSAFAGMRTDQYDDEEEARAMGCDDGFQESAQ